MTAPKIKAFGFDDNAQNGGAATDEVKNPSIKLVIYDFDQTITQIHLYHALDGGQEDALTKMSDDRLLEVFGDTDRKQRLHEHFERISKECELCILSFGWAKVIETALQRMDLFKFFSNSLIIGKDSDELKNAGSKAKCISKLKKDRKLKSNQVIFVDDDNVNIQKAMNYCKTVLITPRNGMTFMQMKSIEQMCGVYPHKQLYMELSTPKTVNSQSTKKYPSQTNIHEHHGQKENNSLAQYKIKEVPQWFDNLTHGGNDTPVIQIDGDQTPNSDSDCELNVPVLNTVIDPKQKPKNGLSLNLSSDISDFDDDELSINMNSNNNTPLISLNHYNMNSNQLQNGNNSNNDSDNNDKNENNETKEENNDKTDKNVSKENEDKLDENESGSKKESNENDENNDNNNDDVVKNGNNSNPQMN